MKPIYQTTLRHMPEDSNIDTHHRGYLKYCKPMGSSVFSVSPKEFQQNFQVTTELSNLKWLCKLA
jgi:hypothetical protein